MEERKHKGGALNIIGDTFDSLMKSCEKSVAENPELVIMYDLESGFPHTATKEYRDSYLKMWDEIMPKTAYKPTGKMFIFGTGGDMNNNSKDFIKLFKQNNHERRKN